MRRGLFGGSFDPPHVGHLMMAEVARESLGLETVDFIPAGIPPHKTGQRLQPATFRLRMLEQAVRDFPQFHVSTIELERAGVSYTVDTVRAMKAAAPRDDWFLIVGADMLLDLPRWKDADHLLALVTVAAAPRPGVDVRVAADNLMRTFHNAHVCALEMPELDVSSTWLRERMHRGLRVDPLLPTGVWDLIVAEGGYTA